MQYIGNEEVIMNDTRSEQKTYRLRKSRNIMKYYYAIFRKRQHSLSPAVKSELESQFKGLDNALNGHERVEADTFARRLEQLGSVHLTKSMFDYVKELGFAIVLALVIATIVRQMWFELYEIPTGSMRPTFEEQDRLTVTKTAFGINIPLVTDHFYFDPNLVQRTGVVIFTGDKIDLEDTDTKYFYVFPAKKRYIKRLIGKPGDSLYFYGGKIYGVDKNGATIDEYQNSPWMRNLEHIPILSFEGKHDTPSDREIVFKQMNQAIGRLVMTPSHQIFGEILAKGKWVKDNPLSANEKHSDIQTYSDFYGMRNIAKVRLLTKNELDGMAGLDKDGLQKGSLYLELSHTPYLTNPQLQSGSKSSRDNTLVKTYKTALPLKKEHIDKIMDNMYTARFVVKNHYATRYSPEGVRFYEGSPKFPNVPDGTYEFYFGKGWQIGWGGIAYPLPKDHPLYDHSPENVQKLFNMGMELSTFVSPYRGNEYNFPNRYAYFNDENLYLLGVPLLMKDDPMLIAFNQREQKLSSEATKAKPYISFKDHGPPVKESGQLDVDFIRTFGVTLPDKYYLVLGDNHAMSADSRVFGFVPEVNLEGAPSLIIWPPGDRIGSPAQKPYPFITLPRIIVWSVFAVVMIIAWLISRFLKKIK